jgi:hypothetical protein
VTGSPDAADATELARRERQFPGHRIGRVIRFDRIRYVAQARTLDIHPYLVISRSLDEVCEHLAAQRRPGQ